MCNLPVFTPNTWYIFYWCLLKCNFYKNVDKTQLFILLWFWATSDWAQSLLLNSDITQRKVQETTCSIIEEIQVGRVQASSLLAVLAVLSLWPKLIFFLFFSELRFVLEDLLGGRIWQCLEYHAMPGIGSRPPSQSMSSDGEAISLLLISCPFSLVVKNAFSSQDHKDHLSFFLRIS